MRNIGAFWEVPGFWQMVLVLALLVAMFTIAICYGPDEAPYDEPADQDSEDEL